MRLALAPVIAVAFAAAFATPAFAKLPVKTVKIAEKHKQYEIDVAYPKTGNEAIDADTAGWAESVVKEFRSEATGNGGDDSMGPYRLLITFDVPRNDDRVFAVVFSEGLDEGGAHPNSFFNTMNFLMPDGWQVYLPEIFTPDGLKAISRLATADLKKQLEPDEGFPADMITSGAGPAWENFADFTILPDALDIQYPPYAVAPYVAGPQETKIPLAVLKPYLRPNWRAPQASFDCAKATAPIEKTICSDANLARQDRYVAEAYRQKAGGTDEAAKKPIRDAQRAWLASRTAQCGAKKGAAAIACLTSLYDARLTALTGAP
ncbi:MAG: DUF3298 domain-containing protein [Proteobacteria bacterium]|nr:DUF3298 domain-containing protein [Pseudomonadota bacterium]